MKTRVAIAREANRDLEIDEVELEGPKEGEVLSRFWRNCAPYLHLAHI